MNKNKHVESYKMTKERIINLPFPQKIGEMEEGGGNESWSIIRTKTSMDIHHHNGSVIIDKRRLEQYFRDHLVTRVTSARFFRWLKLSLCVGHLWSDYLDLCLIFLLRLLRRLCLFLRHLSLIYTYDNIVHEYTILIIMMDGWDGNQRTLR